MARGATPGEGAPATPTMPAETPMPTPPGISPCSIKVIGVGGGGGNTINRMASVAGAGGFLEFVAVNTDVQALAASQADVRVQIGDDGARGLGAGGIPAVGRASAIAAEDDLYPIVAGVDMVFVTAGMGGGTGSGAAPVVAELAKSAGCLTVGIVTKPFSFEGQRRMNQALEAIDNLQESVDILVTVSNDKVRSEAAALPCPRAALRRSPRRRAAARHPVPEWAPQIGSARQAAFPHVARRLLLAIAASRDRPGGDASAGGLLHRG